MPHRPDRQRQLAAKSGIVSGHETATEGDDWQSAAERTDPIPNGGNGYLLLIT